MKLGVLTVALGDQPLDKALGFLEDQGVQMVEIGCGGCPGTAHCDPEILLNDESELKKFVKTVESHHMEISALSVHCNTIHPNKEIAARADYETRRAVLMAEKLGVGQINTFSGCAGDCENSKYPNWVTCAWPEDYLAVLDYQWNKCLVPYWRSFVPFARQHGVNKIAFEPHPGFMVYNTETVLRIRNEVGPEIGANLDPSHLIWQGMEPVQVIKKLGDAIFHFHAKDTRIDPVNAAVNGVLDTKHYSDEMNRSWIFRTVGYGNGEAYWRDIISALRLVGYDYAVSIEHEDSLMSSPEGLKKAIAFLKPIIINEPVGTMFWA
ncbi:MAG: sugar phosphate isomerase/epimerase [Firmicutes bacterium]|nr:sugar phosphate isomerase/epimerase [Bacillota bacterium]